MASLFNAMAGLIRGSQAATSTTDQDQDGPSATIEEIVEETASVSITADAHHKNTTDAMDVDSTTIAEETRVTHTSGESSHPAAPISSPSILSTSTATSRPRSSSVPVSKDNEMHRFGYVYDVRMMAHHPVAVSDNEKDDLSHPEEPRRIAMIFAKLSTNGCIKRMKQIRIRHVRMAEALLVHSENHWEKVMQFRHMDLDDIVLSAAYYNFLSLYVNQSTTEAALLSCGGVIEATLVVARGELERTFAIVRPPGHHAEPEEHMGFCFFNNVAVAARVAQQLTPAKRILILDWDVHHGNGTQKAFNADKSVLYMSLHRYEGGSFYPGGPFGGADSCGEDEGEGTSVNIPWPEKGMGDAEYLLAFVKLVMPIAMEFSPDLVIISAGFDAALGDDLGECKVSPAGFAHMTHMLMSLCGGKIVVALEGGYNLESISNSALAVTRVLLGDAPPEIAPLVANESGSETIWQVAKIQSQFWKNLDVRACEPIEELKDETLSIPEVLKLHRQDQLFRQYGMLEIPLLDSEAEDRLQSQVICSKDFMDKKETVVLFVHEFGNIRVELANAKTCDVALESSYLHDTTKELLAWITKSEFGYSEVNTYPRPATARYRKSSRELARDTIVYLWDNYVLLSGAQNIILIGNGPGCDAIMHLLAARGRTVMQKVRAVALILDKEDIPTISRENMQLRKWYIRHAFIAAPHNHPFNIMNAVRKAHGSVKFFEEERTVLMMKRALPRMIEFIETKLTLTENDE